jgi:hypothetical protein
MMANWWGRPEVEERKIEVLDEAVTIKATPGLVEMTIVTDASTTILKLRPDTIETMIARLRVASEAAALMWEKRP